MVEQQVKKVRRTMERLEVILEDVLIAIISFIVILVIFGVLSIAANPQASAKSAVYILVSIGWSILPWIVMLGILVIARDFWIVRRILERAVRIEAKLEREFEQEIKEEKESESKQVE